MIFYNGFNLMIDLIIMGVAVYAVKRSWLKGYGAGEADAATNTLEAMEFALAEERRGEEIWDNGTTLIRISDLKKGQGK